MQTIIRNGQSALDVVLQVCGAIESVLSVANNNNISITGNIPLGQPIEYRSEDIIEKRVAVYYTDRGIKPATNIPNNRLKTTIGGWRIGNHIIR